MREYSTAYRSIFEGENVLAVDEGATKDDVEQAMEGHVLCYDEIQPG